MSEKICPIMAKGWLSNSHSALELINGFYYGRNSVVKGKELDKVFSQVPQCVKRNCACWDGITGSCGLMRKIESSFR